MVYCLSKIKMGFIQLYAAHHQSKTERYVCQILNKITWIMYEPINRQTTAQMIHIRSAGESVMLDHTVHGRWSIADLEFGIRAIIWVMPSKDCRPIFGKGSRRRQPLKNVGLDNEVFTPNIWSGFMLLICGNITRFIAGLHSTVQTNIGNQQSLANQPLTDSWQWRQSTNEIVVFDYLDTDSKLVVPFDMLHLVSQMNYLLLFVNPIPISRSPTLITSSSSAGSPLSPSINSPILSLLAYFLKLFSLFFSILVPCGRLSWLSAGKLRSWYDLNVVGHDTAPCKVSWRTFVNAILLKLNRSA